MGLNGNVLNLLRTKIYVEYKKIITNAYTLDKISQTFKVINNLAKLFVYFQITNLKSCQNAKNAK